MINKVSPVGLFVGLPTSRQRFVLDVVVDGTSVVADAFNVTMIELREVTIQRKLHYTTLVSRGLLDNHFSMAEEDVNTFFDWSSITRTDSPAYIIAGYAPGEDFQSSKSLTYATFHFARTETPQMVELDEKNSSCLVSTAWDWSNDFYSRESEITPNFGNRWSKEFQAYRYKRKKTGWASGQTVISSKNKVRGKGKVFSFHLKSEPGMDCQLQGWSLFMSGGSRV